MIADFVKRTPFQPAENVSFPIYLHTGGDRYFMKIKSGTEYTWVELTDTKYCKQWASGSAQCAPDEYLDIETLVALMHRSSEKIYLSKLRELAHYYAGIKKALNL